VRDGAEEARDIVESYERGGNRYVVKPGDFEQFARWVSELGLYWLLLNQPPSAAAVPPRESPSSARRVTHA